MQSVSAEVSFAAEIDDLIEDLDISIIEALLEWTERKKVEPETAADLVKRDPILRGRVFEEARRVFMVKGGRQASLSL